MHIPVGRRPAESLGLKEKSDLDDWLKTASKEEMEERHKSCSYRKGSAGAGLVINGSLSCVLSPSNLVGTAISAQQLHVGHREQRKIEKAAKEMLGVDFRKGADRVPRRRHKLAGASVKTGMSIILLGQEDSVAFGMAIKGLDYSCLGTQVEQGIQAASDMLHSNSIVSTLQSLAGEPAQLVQQNLGIDHNPTWEDVLQAPNPKLAFSATAVIGLAVEANVVMLAADLAGEEVHRQVVRASQQDDNDSYHSCDEDEDSEEDREEVFGYGSAQVKASRHN